MPNLYRKKILKYERSPYKRAHTIHQKMSIDGLTQIFSFLLSIYPNKIQIIRVFNCQLEHHILCNRLKQYQHSSKSRIMFSTTNKTLKKIIGTHQPYRSDYQLIVFFRFLSFVSLYRLIDFDCHHFRSFPYNFDNKYWLCGRLVFFFHSAFQIDK